MIPSTLAFAVEDDPQIQDGYGEVITDPPEEVESGEGVEELIQEYGSVNTLAEDTPSISWYNDTDESFTISTAAELLEFAQIVNNKPESSAAGVVEGIDPSIPADDFLGKTVTLTADVDLGGIYDSQEDTWSGEAWPVIGSYTSSGTTDSNDGLLGRPFKGTFDGGLHSISNIYVPYDFAAGDDTPTGNSHGLFGDIGQTAVVKNVIIASGHIEGARFTAGIVGRNWGHIENCMNYASVTANGCGGGAGIAGASLNNSNAATVLNCANFGAIHNSKSDVSESPYPGGIVALNEGIIENCYNVGIVTTGGVPFGSIVGDSVGGSILNSYALDDSAPNIVGTGTGGTLDALSGTKTDAELKDPAFAAVLNGTGSAWLADKISVPLNGGYPVLYGYKGYLGTPVGIVKGSVTGDGEIELTVNEEKGESVEAAVGDTVIITPKAGAGSYMAQLRYAEVPVGFDPETDKLSYKILTPNAGIFSIEMTSTGTVSVVADYVSIVWDGTLDVTWYNPNESVVYLQYAAQFEGLAAIVNGIFTNYPTYLQDTSGSTGAGEVPDYEAYLNEMGAVVERPMVENPEDPTGDLIEGDPLIVSSEYYGEFEKTYILHDSQNGYNATAPMTSTMRVVGNPEYIKALSDSGDTTGPDGGNLMTSDTYFYGKDNFANKTVLIMANLDFGAKKTGNVWDTSSPNFMSLGGQYAMIPDAVGGLSGYTIIGSSWCGTLDGQGHSFSNIYGERYVAGGNSGDSQSYGIIGRMGVRDDDPSGIRPVNPTVKKLVFNSGLISGRCSVGGIVGKIGKTSVDNGDGSIGGIVEYCVNKATVMSTDSKGLGGIVGASWNGGVVRYCANLGRIASTYNNPTGGIVGSNEIPVQNCYSVGTITANGTTDALGIGTNNGGVTGGGTNIVNNYWLTGSASGGGYYNGGAGVTVYEFGSGTDIPTLTASALNGASGSAIWKEDTFGINAYGGVNYPVLFFQGGGYNPYTDYTITVTQSANGTVNASPLSGKYGDSITLTSTPDLGYVLENYAINDNPYTQSSFPVTSDTEVSAEFRALNTITINLPDTTDLDYTITATKKGLAFIDDAFIEVDAYSVNSGDTLYEGDVVTYVATLKADVFPADTDKIYTGSFSYTTQIGTTNKTGASYTVTGSEDGGTINVFATPATTDKTWDQVADTAWYNADDPQDTYTITTARQLAGLVQLFSREDTVSFKDTTIILGNDISLVNDDSTEGRRIWNTENTDSTRTFSGTFDGNNNSITGLDATRSDGMNFGLFNFTNGATIKDLTLEGKIAGVQYTGALVGSASNGTLIENCVVDVDINTTEINVGGIVASLADSSIVDSVYNGTITSTNYNVGGIAASTTASDGTVSISNCVNNGNISGTYAVGGIVGITAGSAATTITECKNTGTVAASENRSGGIVGHLADNGAVLKCINTGDVSGSTTPASHGTGGIAGNVIGDNASVKESYNTGAISTGAGNAGGVVGFINTNATLSDSYNLGPVSATTGRAGGTVGYMATESGELYHSYNAGTTTVTGSGGVTGGVIAYTDSTSATVENLHYLATASSVAIGSQPGTTSYSATAHSAVELKNLAPVLGALWSNVDDTVNNGYPMLFNSLGGEVPVDISELTLEPVPDQYFFGKAVEPDFVLAYGYQLLARDLDYTAVFENNTAVGTATFTITGTGHYTGEISGSFEIVIPPKETGWYEATPGTWMYFENFNPVTSAWRYLSGFWYYFGDDGIMETGVYTDAKGDSYYLGKTGDGKMRASTWAESEPGVWLYLEASGRALKGWQSLSGKWYFFASDKSPEIDSNLEPGIYMATLRQNIAGNTYLLAGGSNGSMQTGWQLEAGERHFYAAPSGRMAKNAWASDSSGWYYMDSNGDMIKDTVAELIGGSYYSFNANGLMRIGWVKTSDDAWIYHSQGGQALTGWQTIRGKWYYFASEVAPAKDSVLTAGPYMAYGRQQVGQNTYYLGADANSGAMLTGWQRIDSIWNYFNSSGAMVKAEWLSTSSGWYYLGSDGGMYTGREEVASKYYFFDATGLMKTGWQKVPADGNKWHYYNNSGAEQSGWITLSDGSYYYLDPENNNAMVAGNHNLAPWGTDPNKRYSDFADSGRWIRYSADQSDW